MMKDMHTMHGQYTHGHHESVLRSHSWRTAENSAKYLLPFIEKGNAILDIGCGPGTITADLAELVNPGHVVAVDSSDKAVEIARKTIDSRGLHNARAMTADLYDLESAGLQSGSFDIVHAHQVLQHVADPVEALRAMSSACKPGGIVAARDSDYHAATWYPASSGLDRWMELYQKIARANGGEPDAGRHMLSWAQAAGFRKIVPSASCWCFATPEDRAWWGGLWADRITKSSIADQALEMGLAAKSDLEGLADAWREWVASPDGWYVIVSGEVLCWT